MADLLEKPIVVAVLGSGGREHALVRKIAASPFCEKVYVLPGNAGILLEKSANTENKIFLNEIDLKDNDEIVSVCKKLEIDLVVVGPDDPLANGVVDALTEAGFKVFGPTKSAARIESSKSFAKEVMERAGVPTAQHILLDSGAIEGLQDAVQRLGGYPLVLKYDGLALGKGVSICENEETAIAFLKAVFESKVFGTSKAKVIVEKFLKGHEVSLFAMTDGKIFSLLAPACDHKRLYDGNRGPNTGGMGAYSPVPWLSKEEQNRMAESIFPALLAELRKSKSTFRGILYAGLMVKGEEFSVLEFNARFGDPETQAILPRLTSDILPLLYGVAVNGFERALDNYPLRWSDLACVNIVAASKGYPEKAVTGVEIDGVPKLFERKPMAPRDHELYFSAVKIKEGKVITSGGRVLSVSALSDSLESARSKALGLIENIRFEGMQYRKDVSHGKSGLD